jgi:hypothetical protein
MTTIVFDGDRLYADTQLTTIDDNNAMVGASIADKIHSNGKATWAGAGSKIIADLFNSSFLRFGMLHLGYQWLFAVDRSDYNHFSNITGGNTILYVTKKYVRTINTKNHFVTVKLLGLRLHLMFIRVTSTYDRRDTVKWIAIGSGSDLVDKYLKDGHTPEVAIKLTAMYDQHTNSLIQTVDCK